MDTDLVIRAQHGDRDAFAELVSAIGGRIQTAADGILRDRSAAQDAAQQALINIWRDLPALREPRRFEAWAYRILLRSCYAEAKRGRRWLPATLTSQETSMDAAPVPRSRDELDGVVDRDLLERAFRRLTIEQRAVVVLHHYLDLSRPDIAEALAVPIGTVNSRLYRAMAVLRAAIDADTRVVTQAPTLKEVVR